MMKSCIVLFETLHSVASKPIHWAGQSKGTPSDCSKIFSMWVLGLQSLHLTHKKSLIAKICTVCRVVASTQVSLE